jgi:hypothetical protein
MGWGLRIAGLAGALSLGLAGAVFAHEAAAQDTAPDCGPAWHKSAQQHAVYGLALLHDYDIASRVALWRQMALGEDAPKDAGAWYPYQDKPVLPADFPDDPDAERILDLVHDDQLQQAADEIVRLTHIPDPKTADVATERVLVRNEVLFSAILWRRGPSAAYALGQSVKKQMALLDAHFLSLPLSTLSADPVIKRAYWRALFDLEHWFLMSGGYIYRGELTAEDDWWLPDSPDDVDYQRGFAEATQESELLDWLQSLQQVEMTARGPWIGYLKQRFGAGQYAKGMAHVVAMAETGTALPWKLVVMRWASPAMLDDPPVAAAVNSVVRDIDTLEQREGRCDLALAEQYALGGLRHDRMRLRALKDQSAITGDLAWNNDITIGEAATADGLTRDAVARFALALGRPEIARSFVPADDDYVGGSSRFDGPPLRALTALDLESFAATNPVPAALNVLPLQLLASLAEGPGLRKDLRAAVARMAWTRAFLLDDQPILKRMTPVLVETNKQLKPLVDAYQAAWTDAGAHRAGLLLLLKAPSMQMVLTEDLFWGIPRLRLYRDEDWPDALLKTDHLNPNDNNWWCRLDLVQLRSQLRETFYNPVVGVPELSGADSDSEGANYSVETLQALDRYRDQVLETHAILNQIDWDELGRLAQIPAAPAYLTGQTADWAEDSWWDRFVNPDQIADALALSIRTTRWGCTRDGSDGDASRRAFVTLKKLFPDSQAAKNTRYWYN